MSGLEDIASYIFMWISHLDVKACKKCRALHGQEFRDQDIYQETLWSAIYGDVWDLNADHSLAHGRAQHNCRCQVTVRVEFDWDKWRVLQDIKEEHFLRKGRMMTAYRSTTTGRFGKGV